MNTFSTLPSCNTMGNPVYHQSSSLHNADLAGLFESLYPKLRTIARSRLAQTGAGETLSATVLVNEAYLKLIDVRGLCLEDRRHFLVYTARTMRTIVIDYLRARSASSRGGDLQEVTWTEGLDVAQPQDVDILDVDRAINHLAAIAPELVDIVELKFGCGMTIDEIARMTELSVRTVNRNWARARAIMLAYLRQPKPTL